MNWLSLALVAGCGNVPPPEVEDCVDYDRDGHCANADCNDADWQTNRDANEIWYDGADQDCGGDDDFDADGDGYHPGEPIVHLYGYLLPDCDDQDATVHPGAIPDCGNGSDDDCDGRPDCGLQGLQSTEDLVEARLIGGDAGRGSHAPDLDGDGVAEWLLGAEDHNAIVTAYTAGEALLEEVEWLALPPAGSSVVGPLGGLDGDDVVLDLGGLLSVHLDPELGTPAFGLDHGSSLVAALAIGDVTGDGENDLVLGGEGGLATTRVYAGPLVDGLGGEDAVAEIVSGWEPTDPYGPSRGAVGQVVLAGSDLTGDGAGDLVVSSGMSTTADALAAVIAGPLPALSTTDDGVHIGSEEVPISYLGLLDGQDWNLDGYDDLVILGDALTRIYWGPFTVDRSAEDADASLGGPGTATQDQAGHPREIVGDMNGDGYPDMGSVGGILGFGLLYGPFVGDVPGWLGDDLRVISPNGPIEQVLPVGDVDGDGTDDVLLQAQCIGTGCVGYSPVVLELLPGFLAPGGF